jgi:hypothetical protein
MIEINGQQYEVLMYVEKINVFKNNLDKLATTLFAAVIAKILFETLFKDIK